MQNKQNSNKRMYKHFWILIIVSILLVTSLWFYNYKYGYGLNFEERGIFGDMFGAVNAIFSGLAFAGIIISLYLQRIDLKNQFEEIKQTNKEFRIQNSTMELQKFENRFFQMLTIHHQIVADIDGSNDLLSEKKDGNLWIYLNSNNRQKYYDLLQEIETDKINTSRDVFKYWLNLLYRIIQDDLIFTNQIDDNIYQNNSKSTYNQKFNQINLFKKSIIEFENNVVDSKFESIYKHIYDKLNADFGHYFRNLYRLVKLVDETTFDTKNKEKDYWKKYEYCCIIRAQLSDYETDWLFFNCLTNKGKEKFKILIEKYAFLKAIKLDDPVYAHFKGLYKPSAFKKSFDNIK